MPGRRVRLSSEVSARIVAGRSHCSEGTSFRKGDLLVRLYDDDARASLMAARSRYMSLLSQQLSDLAVDFPQEADKWNALLQPTFRRRGPAAASGGQQCEGESLSGGPECHFRILRSSAGRDQSAQICCLRPFRRRICDGEQRGRRHRLRRGRDRHHHPDRPARTGSRRRTRLCALFFLRQRR